MSNLKELYQEMQELTVQECSKCIVPFGCCGKEYCEFAIEYTKKHYGVDLTDKIINDKIPFLSETGCVIAPHYRPLCTLHVCSIRGIGYVKDNKEFNEKYFSLREKIMDAHVLNIDEHLRWLSESAKEGEFSEIAADIAKLLSSVPSAYARHEALELIWHTDTYRVVLFITNDGQIAIRKEDKNA